MKCWIGFTPDVTGHAFQKSSTFVSWFHRIFGQKPNVRRDIFFFFDQQCLLPWNSPMDAVFAQSLSYCWIMNTDLIRGKRGLRLFRCCSGLFYDFLDESSFRSWSNVGRPATHGKVHHCYKFSPFVDNGSDCGSLESQSLINGFITLSRLIHFNYFVFNLFFNCFRLRYEALLFKHALLCQTGST